jgi:tetratricopeptide (TPR) repeat protein
MVRVPHRMSQSYQLVTFRRFLMERGSWAEFMDLFATAELVCEDKESLIWGHLCNTAGCVEYERGNAAKSEPYMNTSLRIREKLLSPNDLELSDGYNNYGNLILTKSQSEESVAEALNYFLKGAAINETVPGGEKALHIRYINVGAAYTYQKKFEDASDYFERARKHAIQTFGPGCHFVGRYVNSPSRKWGRC